MNQRDPQSRRSGEPCSHRGCQAHVSHPCEGCGRIAAQGEYRGDWVSQYVCQFFDSDPLRELALAYLKNTEDHDQRICSGREGKVAIPVGGDERRACITFARGELTRLTLIAEENGLLTKPDALWRAIKRAEREFEATYQPPI